MAWSLAGLARARASVDSQQSQPRRVSGETGGRLG
jgi:hypothetical protein